MRSKRLLFALSGRPMGLLIRGPTFACNYSCPTSVMPGFSWSSECLIGSTPPGLASRISVRNFSNSRKWARERALYSPASPLTSRLATVFWVFVGGSLLYYIWKKKKGTGSKKDVTCTEGVAKVPLQGQFSGKTVLITGAAGDIGSATATAFAKQGATLILADLPSKQDGLVKKCSELEALGTVNNSFYITVDMTSAEDVEKMTKFAIEKSPKDQIDCFFNNAGIQGALCPLHEQSDDSFLKVMHVNVYGVFLGMKYVGTTMKNSGGGGVIVNTASLAGLLGPPDMAAYAASKFAVVGMTKTGAKDFAPYGIRVCAIAPGILEGKMWDSQIKGQTECRKRLAGDETEVSEVELKSTEQRMIDGTPLKRLGRLSEVASVVTFLCSSDASYLTGIVIPVDGGRLP